MEDLVLIFHLIFWTTPTTILRPRTDHDHEGNGMMQATSLSRWHPSNASDLHGNVSNRRQKIRIYPLPSKGWICIVSATKAEHGRSFNRRIHTMPPTTRAKDTLHQRLEAFRDTISPFQLPDKAPNIFTLSCQRILPGGEEPSMGSNSTINA